MAMAEDRQEVLRTLEAELLKNGPDRRNKYVKIDRSIYGEIEKLIDEAYEHTLNDRNNTSSLVSVYGDGGVGKSGIVEHICDYLAEQHRSYAMFALDADIFSDAHNKTVKLLDEIVRKLYPEDRGVFLEYVLISECFHAAWDKGSETIFKANDNVFEKEFIDLVRSSAGKILDTVAPLPKKILTFIGSFVSDRFEEKMEGLFLNEQTRRNIRSNEEIGADIVKDTFIDCLNSYLAEEDPFIIILDNSESIYDDFSFAGQQLLEDVYTDLYNVVWYFSGREPFRKDFLPDHSRQELLHVIYHDGEIKGIGPEEIIELTLRRGILVEEKMITHLMAKALGDSTAGNLRWINAKIAAMQKAQRRSFLTADEFYKIVNESEKDLFKRLIDTEFKEYRDEEKTFLLYGCIPQATNSFINEVDKRMTDFSLIHKAEQQWYKSEYEDRYIFSPAVATVLQKYIKEELSSGSNYYITSFIDNLYAVLKAINEETSDNESIRILAEFVSLFMGTDKCLELLRSVPDDDLIRKRLIFNAYVRNTGDYRIYDHFESGRLKNRFFQNEEQKIDYLLKVLRNHLLAADIHYRHVDSLVRNIRGRIVKLKSVTLKNKRTARVERDLDLINLTAALRRKADAEADEQIRYILSLIQSESRCVSDLIGIGYDDCGRLIDNELLEYQAYFDHDLLKDRKNRDQLKAYEGRFLQQCTSILPDAVDRARTILLEREAAAREEYGEQSLQLAAVYKDHHSFARRFGLVEEADQTISSAFAIIKDNYLVYDPDKANKETIKEVSSIIDNLDDWLSDSSWRKDMHGKITDEIRELLLGSDLIYEYANSLSRLVFKAYSANKLYNRTVDFVAESFDADRADDDMMMHFNKSTSGNLYFLEEPYRYYGQAEANYDPEHFKAFDRFAISYLDWYLQKGYGALCKSRNFQIDKRRFYNISRNYPLLINYYRDRFGIAKEDKEKMTFDMAMIAYMYTAAADPGDQTLWYGVERDLERALLVFLSVQAPRSRQNAAKFQGNRRKLLNSYQEKENARNGDTLRKIWYLDWLIAAARVFGRRHYDRDTFERCLIGSYDWMNYLPVTENQGIKDALKDMYFGRDYAAFKMQILDTAGTLSKLHGEVLNRLKLRISSNEHLSHYLDSFRELCRCGFLPYDLNKRYRAMLIELLNDSRYYRNGQTFFVFKDYLYQYPQDKEKTDPVFWRHYYDIYTSFMSVTHQSQEAYDFLSSIVAEADPALAFSLYRRMSYLQEELGDRGLALEHMKKAIDLLQERLDKDNNVWVYVSYLYTIRTLFEDDKEALQYLREKRNAYRHQGQTDLQISFAFDDLIGLYNTHQRPDDIE